MMLFCCGDVLVSDDDGVLRVRSLRPAGEVEAGGDSTVGEVVGIAVLYLAVRPLKDGIFEQSTLSGGEEHEQQAQGRYQDSVPARKHLQGT
jgi:hypothetical protein